MFVWGFIVGDLVREAAGERRLLLEELEVRRAKWGPKIARHVEELDGGRALEELVVPPREIHYTIW
eukprot:10946542-Heterocapsa_arctica.AAC.1